MNNSSEGSTNHRIPSEKSATLAVSLVSLYNQMIEMMLMKGRETSKAPKTVDLKVLILTKNYD